MSRSTPAKPQLVHTGTQGAYKLPALHVLSEIATSLATENVLDSMLERFLSTMIRLAGADAGAVRVLTEDGSHLRLVATVGLPDEVVECERVVGMSCGVCSDAVASHRVEESHDLAHCAERTSAHYFGGRCEHIVSVPLSHKGHTLGVYNLFMPRGAKVPDEVNKLFHSISEQLGHALENARHTRENLRTALTAERQMLSNELHDSLAQTMAYLKTRVALLNEAVRHEDPQKTRRYLDEVAQGMDAAYSELRELLGNLRNRMDSRGLLAALRNVAAGFQHRHGIALQFDNRVPELDLRPEQEVQIFHVLQEALANAVKHSRARLVRLGIEHRGGDLVFSVADDGVGIPPQAAGDASAHYGMVIMRERAQLIGGTTTVTSAPGRGTCVTLTLPAASARKARP